MSTTPSTYSSRHTRTLSPPTSVTNGSTIGLQMQRLNIVTRLAIEGNAKNAENVAIKMYLKLALPADNITPGSAIPLFKEENVKILDSEVHPLDNSSVPYNFSSKTSPLLHNAARALNLPARSPHSYLTLFGQHAIASSRLASTSSSKDPDIPPLEDKYTGHILVSGYQVSFVLPKEFPPHAKVNGRLDSINGSDYTPLPAKLRSRRGSVSEKNVVLFMAGISMMVPYVTKPQRAPWLLSIPTPRCLSNHLKLRIFPPNSPTSTSSSFQSLSSTETDSDSPTWDMTADPHVTRTASSRRSAYQYQHFADDESSDSASAPGFSDGVGIQGTFPSTERVRVRWAVPVRSVDDGRRRAGVADARGEMVCTVLGRERGGVLMHLDYKAACHGVWFPGVATLLGMDVALEAKGCDVTWAGGTDARWNVVGGTGYTGHEIGGAAQPPHVLEKQTSFDMPQISIASNSPTAVPTNSQLPSRQSSLSSTSSLLRAPLPSQQVPEYSFESGPATPSESGMSSILSSTDPNSRGRSRASSLADPEPDIPQPSLPITLHLNINDLLPPNKNVFTFSISGVVLVTPRGVSPDGDSAGPDDLAVTVPRFRVLAADAEKIDTAVRNGLDGPSARVDLYASQDPKARRNELARGSRSKVGSDGGRIVLRPQLRSTSPTPFRTPRQRDDSDGSSGGRPPSRPRTPDLQRLASTSAMRETLFMSLRPRRDGRLMLPYVNAVVTPLAAPGAYAVRVLLPAPADADSEWLDFGLGQAPSPASPAPPRVEIVSASVDGVPVRFETTAAARPEQSTMSALAFEEMSGREWVTWVRVRVGGSGGGMVEFTYVVKEENAVFEKSRKGKGKATGMDVILPTFSLPVGRLQVEVESLSGFEITSLQSNLTHQRTKNDSWRLFHYALPEFFFSQLHVHVVPSGSKSSWTTQILRLLRILAFIAPTLLSIGLLLLLLSMTTELATMRRSLEACAVAPGYDWGGPPPPVTVTATIVSRSPVATDTLGPSESSTPTITMIDVTAPSSTGGTSAHNERQALLTFQHMRLHWPLFTFELPFTREEAVDALVEGLGAAWQILRRIYHYPLDPPT
ncbi:hypothetical protein BV25DRAFT_911170 [Artomyces pyxidatus]|uniref:Uncharacterized protein n=1 Tax=Artomyces pyxidatus TaxID=48021 RepID=A0ACB8SYE9_9AGAM|nr:hypothetical protein BV25DRAFT_911170 [Artomyces pyxidatus]